MRAASLVPTCGLLLGNDDHGRDIAAGPGQPSDLTIAGLDQLTQLACLETVLRERWQDHKDRERMERAIPL
jgi:hypothetical protein